MSTTADDFDHGAVRLAVLGMRTAYEWNHAIGRTVDFDEDSAGISAVNFVNWACALEERLRKTCDETAFVVGRNAHEYGRLIPGLRHVRDRHMHQVVLSVRPAFTLYGGPSRSALLAEMIWRPADEIKDASKRWITKHPEYVAQRESYRNCLQGQPTNITLGQALHWLTGAVEARGLELPEWRWPD